MSYLRSIRVDELTAWLCENITEEIINNPEKIAKLLLDKFEILFTSKTPV